MRLSPLFDMLVVRVVEEDSRGRFLLPRGVASEHHCYGEVIAAGPGTRFPDGTLLPLNVAVGDTVLFRKLSGEDMLMDGEKYRLLHEGEVIGILGAEPLVAVARVAL